LTTELEKIKNKCKMRIFLIKHKGATIWHNMYFDREMTFSNGNKINTGLLFFRKKDAEAFLQTLSYKDLYEVVGASVDKSKGDNRKTNS
jgi:hypothetical protein